MRLRLTCGCQQAASEGRMSEGGELTHPGNLNVALQDMAQHNRFSKN